MALPRAGENFMVVWVNGKGQVAVDRDVMLLNMKEVITTKEDQPEIAGPKGKYPLALRRVENSKF